MADEKNIEDIYSKVNQTSLVLIGAILTVLIVIGGAVFFSLQKASAEGQVERLDAEITSLQTEITALEGEKVEAARTAQQWLKSLEDQEIYWSRVISRIQSLIPYDATSQEAKVKVMSYSGTPGGKINLNVQSRATKMEPFEDVAELISVFNDSSFFANGIVPSVTRGENDQGAKTASFVFNVEYRETSPEDIEAAIGAITTDEAAVEDPGISRQ